MDAAKPFFPSTQTQHAAWVVAATITFLIYSILGVAATIVHRRRISSLKLYDYAIIAALLIAFVQSILLIRACDNGLGRHQRILSDSARDSFHKEYFSASILLIVVHTLAKLSNLLFFMTINSRYELKLVSYGVMGLIVLWGVSSIFLLAFRCGLSSPWLGNEDKCRDYFSVFLGIDLVNVLTDIMLVVLPVVMMWGLQIGSSMKTRVIALFASRILVPFIRIIQIAYLHRLKSTDLTWTTVEPSVLGEIALSMSILTACIPSLKSGIEVFFSGASQFVVPTEYTSSHSANRSGSHGIRSLLPNKIRALGKSGGRTQPSRNHSHVDETKKGSFLRSRERGEQPHTIPERSESQTNLRDQNITRTVEWDVTYETGDHASSGRATRSDEGSYDKGSEYRSKVN